MISDGADRRNHYKVEKWYNGEQHVELLHASNDLGRAQALFATQTHRPPRGHYTLPQGIRVLQRWPSGD